MVDIVLLGGFMTKPRDCQISLRMPHDFLAKIQKFADRGDISFSEALRVLATKGFSAIDIEHRLATLQRRESHHDLLSFAQSVVGRAKVAQYRS